MICITFNDDDNGEEQCHGKSKTSAVANMTSDGDNERKDAVKALLCVHRPPVQFSMAWLSPSHILPRWRGAGALHSLHRCLSH